MRENIYTVKTKYGHVDLFDWHGYAGMSDAKRNAIINGCGPTGWKILKGIRNYILGIWVQPACDLHDVDYELSEPDIEDKKKADRIFHNNLYRLIDKKEDQWFWVRALRYKKADLYFYLVVKRGGTSFWKNKN